MDPGDILTILAFGLVVLFVVQRVVFWALRKLGLVSTHTNESPEEQPAVMSHDEQSGMQHDAHVHAHLAYLTREWARSDIPNQRTEPANQAGGYQKLTERQQVAAEKALRAGLSMTDVCTLVGGTKASRLEELRPIKARIDSELLAKEIANPLIEVGEMEPVPH
ncbi:MAG: hypothetical protein M3R24_41540 [Chloroflexota bacterium]|nr:hypothetical protein [Chloroflexota bacterium]